MLTIETLKKALNEDRAGFIKGLIAAGFVDEVVYNATASDTELIALAIVIFSDLDGAFNQEEFKSWVYTLA